MHALKLAKVLVLIGLVTTAVACRPKPKPQVMPPAPAPADERTVAAIRQQFQAIDPRTIVGMVIKVLPSDALLAVGDVPTDQFKVGDVMGIYNTDTVLLAQGRVIRITADTVHLKYDRPEAGQRAPAEGDLAIRVLSSATQPRR